MEESKDLYKLHDLFIFFTYLSVVLEIYVFSGISPKYVSDITHTLSSLSIYKNILYSKGFTILLALITSIGTRSKKSLEFDPFSMILFPFLWGVSILFGSIMSLQKIFPYHFAVYAILSVVGVVLIHIAFDSFSKYFNHGLGKDKFNLENESFDQVKEKIDTKYSINIPTLFYYKSKLRNGWINITNPFRGTWVLGTPGSGKTFSIIEPIIRQHSSKGFSLVVYDYKFPTLARKLYFHYNLNKRRNKIPSGCKFRIINFSNVEYSNRINPIQKKYIPNQAAAQETASTLIESLQKGKEQKGGADDFFQKSSENFLAAIIYFFTRYDNGRYSSMAHVLSLLNRDYNSIFDLLSTNKEVYPLIAPFITAFEHKAMDQLEGMIGTLRVNASRLATKESFWIFTGDDFDLRVSDPDSPSYLLIANDPEMESINSSLNALILNRLVTRVNSGEGKNIPVNIIIDELPTLYFHKIDRLVGTARSNKVAVTLGFQELPQLESDYGKVGMEKIVSICANVICASARHKATLDWMQSIFGKVKQIKKGVNIDRNKTTININEEMGDLLPAAKIADMPAGFLCGQTSREFIATKSGGGNSFDITTSEEFTTTKFYAKTNFDLEQLSKEKELYSEKLPIIYDFKSPEEKEQILLENFDRVNKEVDFILSTIHHKTKE